MKLTSLVFALAAGLLLYGVAAARPTRPLAAAPALLEMPAVGTMAPEFTLPNNDNEQVKLSQYRGKYVVLYFYPADFTSGCTIEAHNFQADLDKYEALNAVILGVSVQDVDSHKKFCTQEGLHFHLLADADKKVSALYGTLGAQGYDNRVTFLLDPTGKIVKVYPRVNPNTHSPEVLADLKAMEGKS